MVATMPKAATSPRAPLPTGGFSLVAFRAGAAPAVAAEADAPTRLIVAPWGSHDARERGKVIIGQRTLEAFDASQRALKLDRVAIDFDHNTVPGTEAYKASQEPRKVAGFGRAVIEDGVGIVLVDIEWTPEGLEALRGGHYPDLSPAPYRDPAGNVVGLHSVGLVRHGELDGLTLEWAKNAGKLLLSSLTALAAVAPETSLSDNQKLMKNLLSKLLAAIGITLPEDADDAALETAVTEGAAKLEAMMAKPKEEVKPDAMSAEVKAIRDELAAFRAERESEKRQALVDAATRDGKVIPLSAEDIAKLPITVLSAMVDKLPANQVTTERKTAKVQPNGDKPDTFDAETLAMAERLGVTLDELKALPKADDTTKAKAA